MYLTNAEKVMCDELGISIDKETKVAENLEYAGFGVYVGNDGSVFEKLGEELVEVDTFEVAAEKRFLNQRKR